MKRIENRKIICKKVGVYDSCERCIHGKPHVFTGHYNCCGYTEIYRGKGLPECLKNRCVLVKKDETNS